VRTDGQGQMEISSKDVTKLRNGPREWLMANAAEINAEINKQREVDDE